MEGVAHTRYACRGRGRRGHEVRFVVQLQQNVSSWLCVYWLSNVERGTDATGVWHERICWVSGSDDEAGKRQKRRRTSWAGRKRPRTRLPTQLQVHRCPIACVKAVQYMYRFNKAKCKRRASLRTACEARLVKPYYRTEAARCRLSLHTLAFSFGLSAVRIALLTCVEVSFTRLGC